LTSQLEVIDRPLDNQIRLLVLQGELDRTTTPSLAATLRSAHSRDRLGVIVDLTELTSLDASGIGLLRDSNLRLAGAGGRLVVVSDELRDAWLLATTRWGSTPDVFHSRAAAVAAVKRRSLLVQPMAVRSLLDVPAG
jgi:anti-anti-sigma factor